MNDEYIVKLIDSEKCYYLALSFSEEGYTLKDDIFNATRFQSINALNKFIKEIEFEEHYDVIIEKVKYKIEVIYSFKYN